MRGISKPLIALLACSACLSAIWASAAAAADVRIADAGQQDILQSGLLVWVSKQNPGEVRLASLSSTFDHRAGRAGGASPGGRGSRSDGGFGGVAEVGRESQRSAG